MNIAPFPRSVVNRNLRAGLNLALLVLIVISFATGWIASLLGLTEFAPHKYSSIALFVVVAAHVALHARMLAVQLRRLVLHQEPAPFLRRIGDRRPPSHQTRLAGLGRNTRNGED
jgi:hypothetical protein